MLKSGPSKSTNQPPKELFVGQIDNGYITLFQTLMEGLSAEFKEQYGEFDISYRTSCVCNYDYYTNQTEYTQKEYGNMLLDPESWSGKYKDSCIQIVNHALQLSGYGVYLEHHQGELIATHNICCSVNYYHNRTGAVDFHQDSFGRELFVLLIYLDTVDGPEWKLKNPAQFETRMQKISERGLMPICFIDTVQDLYKSASANNDGSVNWVGPVEGPGGIVGFVDELMIHSTPYIGHRESNQDALLGILSKMQGESSDSQVLNGITFLQTIIEGIKNDHYISIDELQGIVKSEYTEDKEGISAVLNELYNELGKLEESRQGGDLILGSSQHDIYQDSNTDITNRIPQHTGSRRRRMSEVLQTTTLDIPEKRSFLRVWVTALPKLS